MYRNRLYLYCIINNRTNDRIQQLQDRHTGDFSPEAGKTPHKSFGLETCRRAQIESLRAERFTPPDNSGIFDMPGVPQLLPADSQMLAAVACVRPQNTTLYVDIWHTLCLNVFYDALQMES